MIFINGQNIIVIGGNVAGPSAAAKAKRTNPDSNVILFEEGEFISTASCQLPYFLSGEIKQKDHLMLYSAESFFDEKKVIVKNNSYVKEIDRKKREIYYFDRKNNCHKVQKYDKLILCTGSNSRRIGTITKNIENVFYLKTLRSFLDIDNFIKNNPVKNIAIIGAGYIGLEVAEELSKRNFNISLIEKESLPLSDFDKTTSKIILGKLEENGINFYSNIENINFDIRENYIKNIKISNQVLLPTDLVLIAIGVEPNNILASASKLEIGKYGGLKVDNKMCTSDTRIFAAGDNVELLNCITNKPDYFPFASIAHNCGHTAGANSAGNNLIFNSVVKNVSLDLFDNCIVKVGLNQSEIMKYGYNFKIQHVAEYNKSKNFTDRKLCYAKIFYQKDNYKIFGASLIGGDEVVGIGNLISFMIRNNIGANKLTNINFSYTPKLSSMINILEILGRKILQN